ATLLTKAIASAKSENFRSRTISSPSRRQSEPSSRAATSSSESSVMGLSSCIAMRIVSLVPHAPELLFALGLGDDVVGVTHECDHPPAVANLPQVTRDVLPPGLSTAEIDAQVRERTERGAAIYALDE